MGKTLYLNYFLDDIGHSVHCMNTIAVSLSNLSDETVKPKNLNVSWKSGNISKSRINARRFAIKSSIVYSVENLFEYLSNISRDNLWSNTGKNFNELSKQNVSKAKRVISFLDGIPGIEKEWIILTELLCHWRNKVIHASSSKADISKASRDYLLSQSKNIYDNYYHFDVKMALDNFEKNKFTLKDVTTLITIAIKCTRAVDKYFISTANSLDCDEILGFLGSNIEFKNLINQQNSKKRNRQVLKWVDINYNFLNAELIERINRNT